jgi:hypothetical protein
MVYHTSREFYSSITRTRVRVTIMGKISKTLHITLARYTRFG